MKDAPISLIEYFVTDLSLTAKRDFAPEKSVEVKVGEYSVETDLQPVHIDQAPSKRWQMTLGIRYQAGPETNFPYAFRLVLVGMFSSAPYLKPESEERIVRVNSASVLYGMAREIIRATTGRGPHRPVIIPTVSFYDPPPTPADAVKAPSDSKQVEGNGPPTRKRTRKTRAKPEGNGHPAE